VVVPIANEKTDYLEIEPSIQPKRLEVSHLNRPPITLRHALANREVLRLLLMVIVVVYLTSIAILFKPSVTGNIILENARESHGRLIIAGILPLVLSGIALFVLSRKDTRKTVKN